MPMPKLTLSKASFLKESKQLAGYERFLPSLDLKRKQLVIEQSREEVEHQRLHLELETLVNETVDQLPMLGNPEMDFKDLVSVKNVAYGEENRLGVSLPIIEGVDIEVKKYGLLTKPHWVDLLVSRLSRACELKIRVANAEKRVECMRNATRKATQRVNLVSKILIPHALKNIRKIQIFLSDNERAAVVRSKIAKKKKLESAHGNS